MRSAIWHHLYNLKNVKNNNGGVLLLGKLPALACNFTKITLLYGYFPRFENYTYSTKWQEASHI